MLPLSGFAVASALLLCLRPCTGKLSLFYKSPRPFLLPWLLLALLCLSKPSLRPRIVGLWVGGPTRPPLGALEISFFPPCCSLRLLFVAWISAAWQFHDFSMFY